jgi:hypothetical protein
VAMTRCSIPGAGDSLRFQVTSKVATTTSSYYLTSIDFEVYFQGHQKGDSTYFSGF